VSDKSSKAAKDLSASLHHLSAQYKLTTLENKRWKAAFEIKKKHKVKKQVLPQIANEPGSLTMSPATIEKALGLLAQKNREEQEKIA
ncbi:hypothetical protein EJ02DRAFT_424658, partial [Clathrospora elynae]